MNEKEILGKQFEFSRDWFQNPQSFGYIDLYQIGDVCCESGFEIQPHRQICHEISCILEGTGTFCINNMAYSVKPGDVFVCSYGQRHIIQTDLNCTLRFVYLGFLFNDQLPKNSDSELLKQFYRSIKEPIIAGNGNLILPFLRLIDEFYNCPALFSEMVQAYIYEIILLTYRLFQSTSAYPYELESEEYSIGGTLYAIIQYIDEHIFELKDIHDIASAIGYSSSYVSHLFREKMGITLQKYLSDKKIEMGKDLLKYSHMSVTQIAKILRYETIHSFSNAFSRTIGMSPSEYLKQLTV